MHRNKAPKVIHPRVKILANATWSGVTAQLGFVLSIPSISHITSALNFPTSLLEIMLLRKAPAAPQDTLAGHLHPKVTGTKDLPFLARLRNPDTAKEPEIKIRDKHADLGTSSHQLCLQWCVHKARGKRRTFERLLTQHYHVLNISSVLKCSFLASPKRTCAADLAKPQELALTCIKSKPWRKTQAGSSNKS